MFTNVMGPLVAGLLAAMIISLANRNLIPRFETWVKRSSDFIDGYLPRILGPLEQTLICIGAAIATCFVMANPEVPPWSVLTSTNRVDDVNTLPMLAAAAALSASLCFAATFLRAAEKDSVDGEVYLGVRLSTFLITRSRATTTLGIPAFHVMVILLFLVPLVQPLLPALLEFTVSGAALRLTLKFAALAIWCSCFAVVGIVLILNILSVLRSSTVGLLQPDRLKFMVRTEIRLRAEQESEWIVRQSDAHQQRYLRYRLQEHLDFAVTQPFEVFSMYYGLTIEKYRCVSWNERSISRYERWCRREDKRSRNQQVPPAGFGQLIAVFMADERRNKAHRLLSAVRDLRLDWLAVIQNGLDTSELAAPVRKYLVERILQEVQSYETQIMQLRHASRQGAFVGLIDQIFQCGTNDLPSMKYRFNYGERGEVVEKIPAEVFNRLTRSLLPQPPTKVPSNAAGVDLTRVLEVADGLMDIRTRLFALETFTTGLMERTILARHKSEKLDVSTLAEMLPKHANEKYTYDPDAKFERASIAIILERVAFGTLNGHVSLNPAFAEALLDFIHGWRIPAALLFRLFYRNRSYDTMLNVADLKPFWDRLKNYSEQDLLLDDDLQLKVQQFLVQSNVGHFVRPGGVAWLFEARKKPLTIELFEEFERMRSSGEFTNFESAEFIQWWLTTRGSGWNVPRILGTTARAVQRAPGVARHGLHEFVEAWIKMDPRGSYQLGMLVDQIFPVKLDES